LSQNINLNKMFDECKDNLNIPNKFKK